MTSHVRRKTITTAMMAGLRNAGKIPAGSLERLLIAGFHLPVIVT